MEKIKNFIGEYSTYINGFAVGWLFVSAKITFVEVVMLILCFITYSIKNKK